MLLCLQQQQKYMNSVISVLNKLFILILSLALLHCTDENTELYRTSTSKWQSQYSTLHLFDPKALDYQTVSQIAIPLWKPCYETSKEIILRNESKVGKWGVWRTKEKNLSIHLLLDILYLLFIDQLISFSLLSENFWSAGALSQSTHPYKS